MRAGRLVPAVRAHFKRCMLYCYGILPLPSAAQSRFMEPTLRKTFSGLAYMGPQFPRASRNGKRMRQEESSNRRAEDCFFSRGEKVLFCCAWVLLWWLISANRYVFALPWHEKWQFEPERPFQSSCQARYEIRNGRISPYGLLMMEYAIYQRGSLAPPTAHFCRCSFIHSRFLWRPDV